MGMEAKEKVREEDTQRDSWPSSSKKGDKLSLYSTTSYKYDSVGIQSI